MLKKIIQKGAKILLLFPVIRYKQFVYEILGVKSIPSSKKNDRPAKFFVGNPKVVGSYSNIFLHENAEIERYCMIIANERFELGENSTLAYGVKIITSADPNGPKNRLSVLYPPLKKPVIVGHDCWIGANSTILPGVTIGDYCVVAAGSVVTKDVPMGCLVAGSPAVIKKRFDLSLFE